MTKLPSYLQDRWNRQVSMIRRKSFRKLKLTDLLNFFNEETILVNNALFSRHGVCQYAEDQHKSKTRDQKEGETRNFLTGSIDEASIVKFKSPKKCPVCDKLHDEEDCLVYLTKPVEERSKLLYKLKLYYGCLELISKEPSARKCSQRRSCKVCKERHLTLHSVKVEKGNTGDKDKHDHNQNKEGHSICEDLPVQLYLCRFRCGEYVCCSCKRVP